MVEVGITKLGIFRIVSKEPDRHVGERFGDYHITFFSQGYRSRIVVPTFQRDSKQRALNQSGIDGKDGTTADEPAADVGTARGIVDIDVFYGVFDVGV